MRMLALALLVANAAFFTWRYNEQVEAKIANARPIAPLSSNTPTLQLVREIDELPPLRSAPATKPAADDAPASTASATAPAAAETPDLSAPTPDESTPPQPSGTGTPSGLCARIGPFATPGEYADLQQWLAPRSTNMQIERVNTTKRQLFWVYLEPKSDSDAKASIADLRQKGVQDYLLINRNGLKNAISLGVFSSQDAVNRRLAEMGKQGYSPLVVPRIETTDMHWLKVEFATGYDDADSIPPDVRGNAGVEALDCSRLADTSDSPEA